MATDVHSSPPGRRPLPEGERKVITSVLLPPEQRDHIKRLAAQTNQRQSDVIRELLTLGVRKFERLHRINS
jgi:predicted DNA-binding protein